MSKGGKHRASSTHHFLAGLTTGCLSASLLQPADLLKTRLQQSQSTQLLPTLRAILSSPNAFRQLWRGTAPSVIRTGFGSALYFSSLNYLRTRIAAQNALTTAPLIRAVTHEGGDSASASASASTSSTLPRLTNTANLTTGALARASAGFLMMPVTILKVRYESSLYAYTSLPSAARAIYATEGLKGFFSGFGATAVRDAPYAGLYVVFYEQWKRKLSLLVGGAETETESESESSLKPATERGWDGEGWKGNEHRKRGGMSTSKSMAVNFTSGIAAAVMATALTNPFDAVKTRVQLMPGRYGNMVRAGRMMVREEGWRSLMDGVGLRVGRKAVSSALAWTGYEELVRRVEGRMVG